MVGVDVLQEEAVGAVAQAVVLVWGVDLVVLYLHGW